jgi:hypothetical protein
MKRLAFLLGLAALLLPSAAGAAACSPLNCAPSQFSIGGSLLGFRAQAEAPVTVVDLGTGDTRWTLPWGFTGGNLLVHQNAYVLNWWDATKGTKAARAKLAQGGVLVGVSQNGTRAVVRRKNVGTEFRIVAPGSPERVVRVGKGNWDFDALSGDNLFLIKYVAGGGYQVRLAHVGSGKVESRPLKDPHESGTIWGQPYQRLASSDGRYLFTLYIGQNGGAMVHELDLKTASARCIDLPGTGNYGSATSWAMLLSTDERTLWMVSPGYGRTVGIDVATRQVSSAFSITLSNWKLGNGTRAALAPDGQHVALADGDSVAVVGLAEQKVLQRKQVKATAVGYSPDGTLRTFS